MPFIGTKKHRYDEFEKIVWSCTGGIETHFNTFSYDKETNAHNEVMIFSYSFLNENINKAMDTITELLSGIIKIEK